MRSLKYLLILTLFITSCKSNKTVVESGEIKKISSRKIVKKHLENEFSARTLEGKLKVKYINKRASKKKKQHSFTVRLRIVKDSIIWIRGNKALTVFKMKITPDAFSFYSPVSKEYFEGDFTALERILGVPLDFDQIQNLLLGKSVFEMRKNGFNSEIVEKSYKLIPKTQEELFHVFFKVNPEHFKLDQMLLESQEKEQSLQIDYTTYSKEQEDYIPMKMAINANGGESYTTIDIEYRSLKLNEPVRVSYRIPSGYKRIELK